MERAIFIIALVMLGVIGIVITMKPMFTIEMIVRFLMPAYHVVKDRKKAKKRVKKESRPFPEPKEKEEVFP